MKRRLNIAAGLVHQPRILFSTSRPSGWIPIPQLHLRARGALAREGMTIVYTSHYMEEVERLCDRVAIMDQGRILALDTTTGLVNRFGAGVISLGLPERRRSRFC